MSHLFGRLSRFRLPSRPASRVRALGLFALLFALLILSPALHAAPPGDSPAPLTYYGTAGDDLDPSFIGGWVTFDASGMHSQDGANAVVVEADGQILSVGAVTNGSDSDFALVRHKPDGLLDSNFGGGGLVTTDFSGPGGHDRAEAAALQIDVSQGYNFNDWAAFATDRLACSGEGGYEVSVNGSTNVIQGNAHSNGSFQLLGGARVTGTNSQLTYVENCSNCASTIPPTPPST